MNALQTPRCILYVAHHAPHHSSDATFYFIMFRCGTFSCFELAPHSIDSITPLDGAVWSWYFGHRTVPVDGYDLLPVWMTFWKMGKHDCCCVVGCSSKRSRNRGLSFYEFPSGPPAEGLLGFGQLIEKVSRNIEHSTFSHIYQPSSRIHICCSVVSTLHHALTYIDRSKHDACCWLPAAASSIDWLMPAL
jgi:hypothetical protein